MTALLSLTGVTAFYGAIQALRGIDLTVDPGEIVTLIGANGAGKSTLMMTICGSPHARTGHIVHQGQDITRWPTHQIMRRGIAQAPEGRRIFNRMTVHENLLMGAEVAGRSEIPTLLEEVFTLFPRLKERISQRGGTLSGGEQQMLAIGRALMSRPTLLLLDEPSLGLAPLVVRQIFGAIRELNRTTGVTVLLVEQNAYQALRLAHRGYVLVNGSITMAGTGSELLARPEIRAAYLEGGHLLSPGARSEGAWVVKPSVESGSCGGAASHGNAAASEQSMACSRPSPKRPSGIRSHHADDTARGSGAPKPYRRRGIGAPTGHRGQRRVGEGVQNYTTR